MKKHFVILISIIILFLGMPLLLAEIYEDCSIYGNCKPEISGGSSLTINQINGSLNGSYWTTATNQYVLSGTKSGDFDIYTTGNIKAGGGFVSEFGTLNDSSFNYAGLISGSGDELKFMRDDDVIHINGGLSSLKNTGKAQFIDVNITYPSTIYRLNHSKFSNYITNEHIDWTNNLDVTKSFSTVTQGIFHQGGNREVYLGVEDSSLLEGTDGVNNIKIGDGVNGYTDGRTKINSSGVINTSQIILSMESNQKNGVLVDGTTNDLNSEWTGNAIYVNDFSRDYNVGTAKLPDNIAGLRSAVTSKHTNAYMSKTPYVYGLSFTAYDTGKWTNNDTVSRTANFYGMEGFVLPSGTLDTINTGGMIFQQYGVSGTIVDSRKLNDSGGNNPNSYLYSYGSKSQVSSNPIVYGGTWNIINYGQHISVTGNKNGTSTNYGLYVSGVSGADNNYGIYDISGTSWIKTSGNTYLRGDNSKIIQGTGDDTSITYNGTDMLINPKEVGTGALIIKGNLKVDDNLTINNLIKLEVMTLPSCSSSTNGTIGRNTTKVYFCDGTIWQGLY